jgi:hypothetical protein
MAIVGELYCLSGDTLNKDWQMKRQMKMGRESLFQLILTPSHPNRVPSHVPNISQHSSEAHRIHKCLRGGSCTDLTKLSQTKTPAHFSALSFKVLTCSFGPPFKTYDALPAITSRRISQSINSWCSSADIGLFRLTGAIPYYTLLVIGSFRWPRDGRRCPRHRTRFHGCSRIFHETCGLGNVLASHTRSRRYD